MGKDRSNNINPKNISPILLVPKIKLLDLSKNFLIIKSESSINSDGILFIAFSNQSNFDLILKLLL